MFSSKLKAQFRFFNRSAHFKERFTLDIQLSTEEDSKVTIIYSASGKILPLRKHDKGITKKFKNLWRRAKSAIYSKQEDKIPFVKEMEIME